MVKMFWPRKILLAILMLGASFLCRSQNLLPNSSFEDINICAEFNAPCAVEAWFYIKPTEIYQMNALPPRILGRNFLPVPVANVINQGAATQWVYSMFSCPLVKGQTYRIVFFLHTVGKQYYPIEMGFSSREPVTNGFEKKNVEVLFPIGTNKFNGELAGGWKNVDFTYTAKGGERFIVLGNISNQPFQFLRSQAMNPQGLVYYFIDGIQVLPSNGIIPCNDVEKKIAKIYNQNHRHSNIGYPIIDTAEAKLWYVDTLSIPSVYFETNKADIRPAFKDLLNDFLAKMKNKTITKMQIVGHTDSVGSDQSNLVLASNRANAVKAYIAQNNPALSKSITTLSKGRSSPIAENSTEEGRSLNRRVEIILTSKNF